MFVTRPLRRALNGILRFDALPWIVKQLLHTKRNTVRLVIDFDDLDLHLLADIEHFSRVIDAMPRNIGDVQEPVDAAEINERAIVGNVLNHTIDDLPLFKDFCTSSWRCSARVLLIRCGGRQRYCRGGDPF